MIMAEDTTNKKDIDLQSSLFGPNKVNKNILGIVCAGCWWPDFKIELYTHNTTLLFNHIGQSDWIIVNLDASGGMVDLPGNPNLVRKILRSMFSVNPKYIFPADQFHLASKILTPLKVTLFISRRNKVSDITAWLQTFRNNEKHLCGSCTRPFFCINRLFSSV